MKVSAILTGKGDAVHSVSPDDTIATAVDCLHAHRIGAVLVLDASGGIAGILSERDVIRGLGERGSGVLELAVSELMTSDIVTCDRNRPLDDLMRDMTSHRIRHLPVVEDGELLGLVSIGDVVKHRVDELELESNQLREYISHG